MPMIDADGCLLNVAVEGRDGGPTIMLSNSLGATMQMWEPQMTALTRLFRVVRYDRRGHGRSGVPPGPYSMERFGKTGDPRRPQHRQGRLVSRYCRWGMVGQWLAPTRPYASTGLSSPTRLSTDPTTAERIKAVRENGLTATPTPGSRMADGGLPRAPSRRSRAHEAMLIACGPRATSPAAQGD